MPIDGREIRESSEVECDVVIIGSGAGGAAAGRALAAAGKSVIFLEEGGYHSPGSHRDTAFSALRRMYRNQGLVMALGAPCFPIPLGQAWGGTTIINSGTCFRAPAEVHDHWVKRRGLTELSLEALGPHYEQIEKDIGVAPAADEVMSKCNTLTREFLAKEGISGSPLLRNVPECQGCGFCCYGCTSGAKKSTDVSLLRQALDFGAKAYVNCRAERLLREKKRVTGVLASLLGADGRPSGFEVRVRSRAVIVAAGTLLTPGFLRRNGVRHAELGRNLTVHPASKVYAEFEQDISGWHGIPQAWSAEALQSDGVLFEGVFLPPDLVVPMVPLPTSELHGFMRRYRNTLSYGFMIEDSTTGRVVDLPIVGRLTGPLIFYRLSQMDADRIHRASVLLARTYLKYGAKRVIPMVQVAGRAPEIRNRKDLEAFEAARPKPSEVEVAAFHPLGTARMGRSREQGVVDTDGRVFGHEGLYVSDGSMMPTALGVNPQLTIMALSDRLGTRLAESL